MTEIKRKQEEVLNRLRHEDVKMFFLHLLKKSNNALLIHSAYFSINSINVLKVVI